ncbi:hypothetical protein PRZ48_006369 [Zasmidium cellare]|uniref:Uncharacterized protein n=1 Tax=Zasmidium cellare TaxID=395010 RepID=A0ABR0EN91_ZASCE|nr:hypothetical protein PRZ48_006369 [Zasmidium cellare]
MHAQSIIAVAVGAAGIANAMPAVGRRSPQYQPDSYSGGNNWGNNKYQGGGYQGGDYGDKSGGHGGGFPFSILNGLGGGGGQGGGILPLGGGGGGGPLSAVSNILPLGGGSGGGLGGIIKRGEQKGQNDPNDWDDDDDDCSEQCEDYCDKYFDGQDWQEQQCENWCPKACSQGNGGGYKPGQQGDPEQAFCSIWDQLQNHNGGGYQGGFGQNGFQKRQNIDRIPPGFGPGPVVSGNRPGQYGGGFQRQCPLWQQGGYQGGRY